jgi:hypothetical protein
MRGTVAQIDLLPCLVRHEDRRAWERPSVKVLAAGKAEFGPHCCADAQEASS